MCCREVGLLLEFFQSKHNAHCPFHLERFFVFFVGWRDKISKTFSDNKFHKTNGIESQHEDEKHVCEQLQSDHSQISCTNSLICRRRVASNSASLPQSDYASVHPPANSVQPIPFFLPKTKSHLALSLANCFPSARAWSRSSANLNATHQLHCPGNNNETASSTHIMAAV